MRPMTHDTWSIEGLLCILSQLHLLEFVLLGPRLEQLPPGLVVSPTLQDPVLFTLRLDLT